MAKLKLNPDPTFKAKVAIPIHGGEAVDVEFTLKHRTRDELETFLESAGKLKDVDMVMEVASGWELADAFNAENVAILVQNYIAAPRAIFDQYLEELVRARTKN